MGSSFSSRKATRVTSQTTSKPTLLHNGMIVTMNPSLEVYKTGAILIDGDRITHIGQSDKLYHQYKNCKGVEVVDLHGKFVLPGFVNTHCHSSQQLARGIGDDMVLGRWLGERMLPYEASMTENDSFVSTLLCGIELIRSGVTCFAEAGGQHVSGMASAVKVLGLRACLTQSIMDNGENIDMMSRFNVPRELIRTADDSIQFQKELHSKYNGTADGRIRIWLGIRQIATSTDELLTRTRDTAKELKTGIHMHVATLPSENQSVAESHEVDGGTVTYLEKIKLLDNNFLAAEVVYVSDSEIDFLSKAEAKVSHCPASAMRSFGIPPTKQLLDAGICVSLGTDGAPSNDRMSIVDEMYLASLSNKAREAFTAGAADPSALPAEAVLKMVTINGAKSVLWDNEIGSLEVQKKADLIIVDPFIWTMVPVIDSISSLVYSMRTENIESVMCNGQWLMKDRKILTVNEQVVIQAAKRASTEIMKKAGITIPTRMNFI